MSRKNSKSNSTNSANASPGSGTAVVPRPITPSNAPLLHLQEFQIGKTIEGPEFYEVRVWNYGTDWAVHHYVSTIIESNNTNKECMVQWYRNRSNSSLKIVPPRGIPSQVTWCMRMEFCLTNEKTAGSNQMSQTDMEMVAVSRTAHLCEDHTYSCQFYNTIEDAMKEHMEKFL